MPSDYKSCLECRWNDPILKTWVGDAYLPSVSTCTHPQTRVWDMVEGWKPKLSAEARKGRSCGPQGTLWEPIPYIVAPARKGKGVSFALLLACLFLASMLLATYLHRLYGG